MSEEPDNHWHTLDQDTMAGWKSYPVRVRGPRPSVCHQAAMLLVQSMHGGFITANCCECGTQETVSWEEFRGLGIWVSCPDCKVPMIPRMVAEEGRAANYGYWCSNCGCLLKLADLLPHWGDVGQE